MWMEAMCSLAIMAGVALIVVGVPIVLMWAIRKFF